MADRCVFFEDLLRPSGGRNRSYELHERPGLTCLDARMRAGPDWLFARRWVRTAGASRELYRTIDRLESSGFRFRVGTQRRIPSQRELQEALAREPLDVRASLLLAGLTAEERLIHAELFPDEHALLARGYDWDGRRVYRTGVALASDGLGRVLDVDGEILYEWVRIEEERTWRRYPLERLRVAVTARGT